MCKLFFIFFNLLHYFFKFLAYTPYLQSSLLLDIPRGKG